MLISSETYTPKNIAQDCFTDEIYRDFEKKLSELKPDWNHIPSIRQDIENIALDLGFIMRFPVEKGMSMKGKYKNIGFNVQLGHKSFLFQDLVKFQHAFNQNIISEALYICMSEYADKKSYSSNLVTFEKSLELVRVFKGIFNIPIYFISLMRE